MASFVFHDLENRIEHIETTRLKNQKDVLKPQRSVLGVINQNTSKVGLPRKAKNVANQKIGLKLQEKSSITDSSSSQQIFNQQQINKPNPLSTTSTSSLSIFNNKNVSNKPSKSAFAFTIHEDDSSDEIQDKEEKDKQTEIHNERHQNEKHFGNDENDQALDELSLLPQGISKAKLWKNEEEPMSLEKSILSPMSVDCSQSDKTEMKNGDDYVCMLINMDDYRDDIYDYLVQCERRIRPKANYMRKQPDINADMRSVLVDWLIEVAEEYKMQNETLHLAINFVDRFLSLMSVVRSKLQLLGTAALFVASKYEEIYPPEVSEFVYITDDTYTKKQVLKMETLILKVLNFDLNIPTVHSFICHITVSASLASSVLYMAQYFSELILVSGDPFLQYLPSVIASSCIALSRYCLDYENIWPETLSIITTYNLEDLHQCIQSIHEIHKNVDINIQKAAYNKYKNDIWKNVSLIQPKIFTL